MGFHIEKKLVKLGVGAAVAVGAGLLGHMGFEAEAQRVRLIGNSNQLTLSASCRSLYDDILTNRAQNPRFTRVASFGDVRFLAQADMDTLNAKAKAGGSNMPARIVFSLDSNQKRMWGLYLISVEALGATSNGEGTMILDRASGTVFCPTNIPGELVSEVRRKVKQVVDPIIHPDDPEISVEEILPVRF